MPEPCYYFYRLDAELEQLCEFCVANARDPNQYVESRAPDGSTQRWESREVGDLLIFHAPDGYNIGDGLLWCYDSTIQVGYAMPREQLERYAMRHRVSGYASIPA